MKIVKQKLAVIYHDKCSDGLTAAGIAKYFLEKAGYQDVLYIGGKYHEDPPELTDTQIFFVDFCYKRHVMDKLISDQNHIVLIDHHKSAIEDVRELFEYPSFEPFVSEDNTQSGTGLAWEYFKGRKGINHLPFAFIQDRDLWTWKLPHAREYLAVHNLRDKTLEEYYKFVVETIEEDFSTVQLTKIVEKGKAILESQNQIYDETISSSLRFLSLAGYDNVPTVNCPGYFMSDIGAKLVNTYDVPFALMWYISESGMKLGLRSKADRSGVDVSIVAKAIHPKGGGHYAASGAMIPPEEFKSNEFFKTLVGL